MPETDDVVDPRTPPASVRPTRRRVLVTGAGAAVLLGLAGRARAAAAPAPLPVRAPAAAPAPAPAPVDLAPYASYWFPDSLPSGAPVPGSCGAR